MLPATVGLVTVAWVVWLVGLPGSAREADPAQGTPTVSDAAPSSSVVPTEPPPPGTTDAGPVAPVGGGDRQGRERPLRDPVASSDVSGVVSALAAVLALSEQEAIGWAEDNGYLWRVTWRDGEAFAYSFDDVPERLNLEISDGIVVFAWFG